MPELFDPLSIRGVTLRNRIGISPMQQYCANEDGKPTPWHLAVLLTRAAGGAGLVFTEASAVQQAGRTNYNDLGLWDDAQIAAHRTIVRAVAAAGAVPAAQLGHSGRKACISSPWSSQKPNPTWTPVAPSALPFGNLPVPHAMDERELIQLTEDYASAAKRANSAGYRVVEIHAAHGYLLHSFLSPIANLRTDEWGGSFENRSRLIMQVAAKVRAQLDDDKALSVRISHTDWIEGGWTTEESRALSERLSTIGVDIIDVSSGGISPNQHIPLGPCYQVPGAEAIKKTGSVLVAAVGLITEPHEAQWIIREGKADMVLIGRASLREPHWPLRAASELGRIDDLKIPPQFARGWTQFGYLAQDLNAAMPLPPLGT